MAYDPRKCLWFGPIGAMQWVATPLREAEASPESFDAGGTLLSGGGWGVGSWGSHKTYTFEWPSYSSAAVAQLMKSYADGTYGRGLIYFHTPDIYETNILPARIADPSMAVDSEGASMVYGVDPEGSVTSGWQTNQLPVQGAYYDLTDVTSGFRGVEDAAFVAIPDGYALLLGAIYDKTGSGGIFVSPQNSNGTIGSASQLTQQSASGSTILGDVVSGIPGVWLWLGKSSSGASSVTAKALIARLVPTELLAGSTHTSGFSAQGTYGTPTSSRFNLVRQGPWIGGMGHSGVRFQGKPSMTINSVAMDQIGYAASFREVGSWAFG